MSNLIAFHGDPAIKAKYLARIRAHRAADELLQGQGYWKGGKGCALGCTLHSSDHSAYERELGIPRTLAYLEDVLFEQMPAELALQWPERFLDAIAVGADLERAMVWQRFIHWVLADSIGLVDDAATNSALIACADLYERWIGGDEPGAREFGALADGAARAARAARAGAHAEKLLELLEGALLTPHAVDRRDLSISGPPACTRDKESRSAPALR